MLDVDQVKILVSKLLQGDLDAGSELAQDHAYYVASRTKRYPARHRNDLYGVGCLALWESVLAASRGELKHDNFTAYAMTRVRHAFCDYFSKQKYRRNKVKIPQRESYSEIFNIPDCTTGVQILYTDIIDLCENDLEREIVKLSVEGLSNQEIAIKLSLRSRQLVWKVRKKLWSRYVNGRN
jgi:RNA polymerase sigma factor (sigma-70 family)